MSSARPRSSILPRYSQTPDASASAKSTTGEAATFLPAVGRPAAHHHTVRRFIFPRLVAPQRPDSMSDWAALSLDEASRRSRFAFLRDPRNRSALLMGGVVAGLLLIGIIAIAATTSSGAGATGTTGGGGTASLEEELSRALGDVVDPFVPSVELAVSFKSRRLLDGVLVTQSESNEAPSVQLFEGGARASSDKRYTLLLVDPDAPSPTNPTAREWLHWIVVDLPGDANVQDAGRTITPYEGPTPPEGTHRYIFLVYQQPVQQLQVEAPAERMGFHARAFAAAHELGAPVGALYFTCAAGE